MTKYKVPDPLIDIDFVQLSALTERTTLQVVDVMCLEKQIKNRKTKILN